MSNSTQDIVFANACFRLNSNTPPVAFAHCRVSHILFLISIILRANVQSRGVANEGRKLGKKREKGRGEKEEKKEGKEKGRKRNLNISNGIEFCLKVIAKLDKISIKIPKSSSF